MAWAKTSRHERGYGAAWDKLRKAVMQRDMGLCQVCAKQGRITLATAVDHITPKSKAKAMGWSTQRTDAQDNLQAICKPCHDAKTAQDEGRTLKPIIETGLDGWPIG